MRRSFRSPARSNVVVTTDMLTDGVDFQRRQATIRGGSAGRHWRRILSDLAAMAARPLAALISLALPRNGAAAIAPLQLAIGIVRRPVAAGGGVRRRDRRRRHEYVRRPARDQRHRARPDRPAAARSLAPAASRAIGCWSPARSAAASWATCSTSRRASAKRSLLHERYELHAGIDISDGLALDASRLADEAAAAR